MSASRPLGEGSGQQSAFGRGSGCKV